MRGRATTQLDAAVSRIVPWNWTSTYSLLVGAVLTLRHEAKQHVRSTCKISRGQSAGRDSFTFVILLKATQRKCKYQMSLFYKNILRSFFLLAFECTAPALPCKFERKSAKNSRRNFIMNYVYLTF